MNELPIRKATTADYLAVMRLIDDVFFPNRPGFASTLPNLYTDPAIALREAYVALDGDRVIGHVGIYPLRLNVGAGAELTCGGIGAVATNPDYRGRGLMSSLLAAAITGMEQAGYDLSVLWGDRMRYAHFGWELVGRLLEWGFDARLATNAGFAPIQMIPFDPAAHLHAVVQSWNADTVGSVQTPESLTNLLLRVRWKIAVGGAWNGSSLLPFALYQVNENRMIVDKLVGPNEQLAPMLLWLRQTLDVKAGRIAVRGPAGNHPLAHLAIRCASSMSQRTSCQARVMSPAALAAKLGIVLPTSLAKDLCGLALGVFGTPADGQAMDIPLYIEEIAHV